MARAMSSCAKAGTGTTISAAPRRACAMSVVTAASGTSVFTAAVLQRQRAAGQQRGQAFGVTPPQCHVVAQVAEVGRSRIGAVATAKHTDLHQKSPQSSRPGSHSTRSGKTHMPRMHST